MPDFAIKEARKVTFARQFVSQTEKRLLAQQGSTEKLLCDDCERRFGVWEDRFCREVYRPLMYGAVAGVNYDIFLQKFLVSLVWRVGTVVLLKDCVLSKQDKKQVGRCLAVWKRFLLNRQQSAGPYQHHMFLFNEHDVEGMILTANKAWSVDFPNGFMAWMMGGIEYGLARLSQGLVVYVKFSGFVLTTYIDPPRHSKVRAIGAQGEFALHTPDYEMLLFCKRQFESTLTTLKSRITPAIQNRLDERLRHELKKESMFTPSRRLRAYLAEFKVH